MIVIIETKDGEDYFKKPVKYFKINNDPEPCCDNMKKALDEYFIDFGDSPDFRSLNTLNSFCIYKCSPYPEGAVFDAMEINFCPFCGEKIILKLK